MKPLNKTNKQIEEMGEYSLKAGVNIAKCLENT